MPEVAAATRHRSGTHRARTPEQTLAWARPLMPALGITRLADVTGLDVVGIPVAVAVRPNARSLSTSQGKGLTLTAAKVSALMEAIETYHAEHIRLPLRHASAEELVAEGLEVEVEGLARAPGTRYHPRLRILWVEARRLVEATSVWIPYAVVHTDFTTDPKPGDDCFSESSNGLASGNCTAEALLHGLCEVIERDAAVLWHLNDGGQQAATRIDLASVGDPACGPLLDRCAHAGLAVGVWELTSDVGVPAFLCQIAAAQDEALRPLPAAAGMGCHPSRAVALARAITEAAQTRLVMVSGSRDDLSRDAYVATTDRDDLARHRALLQRAGGRPFADGPELAGDSGDDDLQTAVGALRGAGFDGALAVDLSRADLGVPVVRTVVPGLEGPDALHGPAVHGPRAQAILRGAA